MVVTTTEGMRLESSALGRGSLPMHEGRHLVKERHGADNTLTVAMLP